MGNLFDRVAGEYDAVVPFFASFGASIVDALDPPPGSRFLDLGAGRGALTDPALARGCVVTAVDAAPGMTARLAPAYPAATVLTMDAHELTFPDASFDVVASAFVIHLLDDPARAVASARRVLAPGGRFALTGGPHPAPGFANDLDALFAEFAGHLPPGGSIGRPLAPTELLAGFTEVREVVVASEVHVADNDVLWRWVMSHGYRAFIEDLPAGPRAEFEDRVRELPLGDGMLRRRSGLWIGSAPMG